MDDSILKIAIPNKGRLKGPTIELLQKAGFDFRVQDRTLYSTCKDSSLQIIFLRTEDIPLLVEKGVIQLGITGEDLVLERNAHLKKILPLNYGKCRLCIAVKENGSIKGIKDLENKTIATSFPNITEKFFNSNKIKINCIEMSGSLEIMIKLKLADAIADIVETGDTLRDNNLIILEDIAKYETSLFANKDFSENPEILRIKRRIEGVLIAQKYSILEYNVKKKKLKEAEIVTPGFESPTVSELDDKEWVAVEVMVEKSKVVNAMDKLEELGATAILETEIKNCRL
jgi:ATP phosphoribosyltransferase